MQKWGDRIPIVVNSCSSSLVKTLDNGVRIFNCRTTTYQKLCFAIQHFPCAISEHLLTVIGMRPFTLDIKKASVVTAGQRLKFLTV
ncbi:hypothetical protein [Vibrio comitans]|uniref:hypothetical protein n=1 Tax=Vibrio comitans TaxID=413401 RepID=UPI001143FCA2|nr:hypothetical protein [Vibrio comitans]